MSTACVLTSAVTTHVYKQHTAACSLLVFSHHLLKQTIKNSIPQHVPCLCSHTTVTKDVYKQHSAAYPLLVFSHHLLQQTFTKSIPQHVHCLCSHNSCYNKRLQTAYGSMSIACVLTPAVTTDVYKQNTAA